MQANTSLQCTETQPSNKPNESEICGTTLIKKDVVLQQIVLKTENEQYKSDVGQEVFNMYIKNNEDISTHTDTGKCDVHKSEKEFSTQSNPGLKTSAHICNKTYEGEIWGKILIKKSAVLPQTEVKTENQQYNSGVGQEEFYMYIKNNEHISTHTGTGEYDNVLKFEKEFSTQSNSETQPSTHTSDKHFVCNVCGKMFSLNGNLKRHMKIHTGDYRCDICGKVFCDNVKLHQHMRKHTDDTRNRCDVCGKTFPEKWSLQRHMRSHTGEKPYKCDVCGNDFSQKAMLHRHIAIHTGEKSFQCEVCGKGFNQNYTLTRHMKTHTSDEKFLYTCDICEKVFYFESSPVKHDSINTEYKPYKCKNCTGNNPYENEMCGTTLIKKDALLSQAEVKTENEQYESDVGQEEFYVKSNEHISPNTDTGEYAVQRCETEFSTQSRLGLQTSTHTGGKPFVCNVCGKMFSLNGNLERHMKIHTGDYRCDFCGKVFCDNVKLRKHIRKHTDDSRNRCDVCGKAFPEKWSLQRHMRAHTGEKPYKCDVCGNDFSQKAMLHRHMTIHTGEKSVQCHVCGKGFNRNCTLKRHMKTHTSDDKFYTCDVCKKVFYFESTQVKHDRINTENKPYKCKNCTGTQTGNNPYENELCGTTLIKKDIVLQQTEVNMDDVGQEEFYVKSNEDISTHTGTGESDDVHRCEKEFSVQSSQGLQTTTHTGNKPCEGEILGKTLIKKSVLLPQTEIKTENEQHESDVGQEEFYVTSNEHINTHTCTGESDVHKCENEFSVHSSSGLQTSTHIGNIPREGEILETSLMEKGVVLSQTEVKTENEQYESDVGQKEFYMHVKSNEDTSTNTDTGEDDVHKCENELSAHSSSGLQTSTHIGNKPFMCNVCGKMFTSNGSLKRHIRIHTGDKPYRCDFCGKAFCDNGTLHHHTRKHTDERRDRCDVCGKAFHDKWSLQRHMRAHTGEKPFTCDVCGNDFSQKAMLHRHMAIHTGEKSYQCEVCGKWFNRNCSLMKHMKTHTNSDAVYKCDVCEKEFNRNSSFTKHMKTHTSDEICYKCDVCKKLFYFIRSPVEQGNTHTEPYKCKQCLIHLQQPILAYTIVSGTVFI